MDQWCHGKREHSLLKEPSLAQHELQPQDQSHNLAQPHIIGESIIPRVFLFAVSKCFAIVRLYQIALRAFDSNIATTQAMPNHHPPSQRSAAS